MYIICKYSLTDLKLIDKLIVSSHTSTQSTASCADWLE